MKKNSFNLLLLSLLAGALPVFQSCSENDTQPGDIAAVTGNLSSKYVAPSGDTLFVDNEAFTSSTTKVLGDIYGIEAGECTVTDIRYALSEIGYAASIEYTAPDGEKANYIMTNIPFVFEGGTLELDETPLKSRLRSSAGTPVKIRSLAIIPLESDRIEILTGKDVLTYSCNGNAAMKYNIR